jgi:hypothetical protein
MTDDQQREEPEALEDVELEGEDVEVLPDRAAMSIVNPNPGEPPLN